MSNQLQITGGAKVRNLEGVLTGTSGVVSSLGINVPSGIPQLDGSGKILVSQLPNSVMEYKGTWSAATNTPTLADGTGNAGDVYLCDAAGTVNFGAGPITFAVGDQVLYSGTIWQKASGATGTVTSVAVTESGDALTITGSPITTAGTINIGFAGSSTQYIAGDGTLVTFPTIVSEAQNLITDVYNETGATLTKGTIVYINGGHGNLPTVTKALATSDATSAQTYGMVQADITNNNNGHVVVIGRVENLDTQAYANGTQLYLSSTTAGAYTDVKQYAPAHLVYVGIVTRSHPTQGVIEVKIQNGYELDELHNVSAQTPSNNDGIFYNSSNSLWEAKSIATALGYTPANAATYVPYTGATSPVNLGVNPLTADGINIDDLGGFGGAVNIRQASSHSLWTGAAYTSMYAGFGNTVTFYFSNDGRTFTFDGSIVSNTSPRTYVMPDASGTLALTSDIPSLTNYVTLNGAQTITGIKTFTNEQLFGNGLTMTGGYITYTSGSYNLTLNTNILTANRNVFLQDKAGTIALTSDIPSLSGTAPISYSAGVISISQATTSTNGYLSSTDWNTFNNKQSALTNPVTGTGTSSYHAKFTGTSTIGNSMLTDDGTTLQSIGATRSNLYLKAASSSYYSQLAFTNGSNSSYGGISYNNAGQYMQIEANGSEWLRLFSNGNLRLFSSSAADNGSKFQVEGTAAISGTLTANGVSIGASDVRSSSGTLTLGGTSEMVRINGTGVGVGTTSIFNRLTSQASGYYGLITIGDNWASDTYTGIKIGAAADTGGAGVDIRSYSYYASSSATSMAIFTNSSANSMTERLRILTDGTLNLGTYHSQAKFCPGADSNHYIRYNTSLDGLEMSGYSGVMFSTLGGSERMRITSSGKLQIAGTLGIGGAVQVFNDSTAGINIMNSANSGNLMVFLNNSAVSIGTITTNNSSTSYNTSSDYRLKEDFKEANGLSILNEIKIYNYKWKNSEDRMDGVIAHELQEIIPYAVTGQKDAVDEKGNIKSQGVDYSKLVPILIKSIQELESRIKKLENK